MEEDIKILKNKIKRSRELNEEIGTHIFFNEDLMNIVENLINRVKELEENRIWSEETISGFKEDFIPKNKIRGKIEELKIKKGYMVIDETNEIIVKTLQELLEDK